MKQVLVTDSLFIYEEHVKQLEAAGYEVVRLDKPEATEEELISALKGKVGYILGGIEKVTEKVLASTDELKAIVFTGTDTEEFIPGLRFAKQKGIAVDNTPGTNAFAVSEYAVAIALAMERNLFELGPLGSKTFETRPSLKGLTIGIVGAGNIGTKVGQMIRAFEPESLLYFSRSENDSLKTQGARFVPLSDLVAASDLIFIAVPKQAEGLLSSDMIAKAKHNALIVSISALEVIDMDALLLRLKAGTLRAAVDWPPPSAEYKSLSPQVWFNSNNHAAYNTFEANQKASDMAVTLLLDLLSSSGVK